jgi:hypothetical protein
MPRELPLRDYTGAQYRSTIITLGCLSSIRFGSLLGGYTAKHPPRTSFLLVPSSWARCPPKQTQGRMTVPGTPRKLAVLKQQANRRLSGSGTVKDSRSRAARRRSSLSLYLAMRSDVAVATSVRRRRVIGGLSTARAQRPRSRAHVDVSKLVQVTGLLKRLRKAVEVAKASSMLSTQEGRPSRTYCRFTIHPRSY